jgi:protein TonB
MPADTAGAAAKVEDALRARIREAVQGAVRCSAAARMMGRSGTATVAFDYRDGTLAGEAQILQTAGVPALDAAALSAVREARYPAAPPEVSHRMLRLMVRVEEACGTS